ncbi:MAG TPA: MFS transporter [Candidatus Limnocylindrales bacterium]|nr:MFS transporter [Candidatus Limnocylindrales bacterium]
MSGPPRHRLRSVRALVIDTEPLRRDPDFRRLWMGQSISVIGNQITRVALPYQVYVLTQSTLALAALTLFQLVPLLLFSLGGGAIADAFDRRKVLLVTQLGLAGTSLGLAVLSLQAEPALPVLFAIAFVASGLAAIDWPARSSATPRLVPPERLRAAIALGQLTFNAGSVLGPIAAGLLIGSIGVAGAYAADVVTFAASLLMLLRIRPIPPLGGSGKAGLEAIREGIRFVRQRRVILSTFAIDLNAMVFGMPTALFPVLAIDVFHTGPVGLGLLTAAPAAGAFAAIVFSGGIGRIRRIGRGIVLAVAAWGAAIVGFGLSTFFFPLALAFLAIAGAADVISAVFRSSVVQMEAPDELRGRVAAIHILVVTSGPRIGDIEAALVASAVGAQLSVISGGLLCLLGVVGVVRAFPELDAHIATDTPRAPAPEATSGGTG